MASSPKCKDSPYDWHPRGPRRVTGSSPGAPGREGSSEGIREGSREGIREGSMEGSERQEQPG